MQVCWNWQTGTFEGRVFSDVRVQVPSPAPIEYFNKIRILLTCLMILKSIDVFFYAYEFIKFF